MYKVLICDDNEAQAQSLIKYIEGSNLGFEICSVADDEPCAWKLLKECRPHLVFVNIQMRGINGLELLKTAEAMNIHTLFAVISNSANFSDIQKVINCGAVGYCLGSFTKSDIQDILGKAKHYIDAEWAYVENEISSLISDTKIRCPDRVAEMLELSGLRWQSTKDITFMVTRSEKMESILAGFNYLRLRLQNRKSVYLVETASLDRIVHCLCTVHGEKDFSVGISDPCESFADMLSGISDASIASDQFFITEQGGIYFSRNLKTTDIKVYLPKIQAAIKNRNIGKTIRFFEQMEQLFTSQTCSVVQAYEFYNIIVSFTLQNSDKKYNLIEGTDKLVESFRNIREELFCLRNLVIESMEIGRFQNKNQTFYRIIRYINSNYQNEELSLQTVACEFTINSNYVSQLFRRETGMTFTEYLTKLRLKNAICLLKGTKMPVCTIAEKSGFTDYFYFARVFKKYTGKSSTVFRELYRNAPCLTGTPLFMDTDSVLPVGTFKSYY